MNVTDPDLYDMLSYDGTGVFENDGADLYAWLWIAARYLRLSPCLRSKDD